MATFWKRKLKDGGVSWEASIRRKGQAVQRKSFDTKAEAEAWAATVESEMSKGVFVSRKEAESTTLSEALDRYETEVATQKKGYWQEKYKIDYWRRSSFGQRYLAALRPMDLAVWRDEYLKDHSPSTVNRLLIVLSHVFTIAVKEWGMGGLVNPVQQIRRPQNPKARDRRFLPEEEKIVMNACLSYGGDLHAIVGIANETGMRRSEISGMTWNLIDLKKKTVTLPDTKNSEKRIVPLSIEAVRILSSIPRRLDGFVWGFESRGMGITQAFRRAVSRARKSYEKECEEKKAKPDPSFLVDLTFHDLRHEATSRFFEKGLNPMQVAAITGHKTLQMLKRYTHLKAEDLAELLK